MKRSFSICKEKHVFHYVEIFTPQVCICEIHSAKSEQVLSDSMENICHVIISATSPLFGFRPHPFLKASVLKVNVAR